MLEELVGTVTHYFGRIGVAVVRLRAPLSVGDVLHIRGKATDFRNLNERSQCGR
ncbi:MAG: hypothetical protein ACK42E_03880 [Candidatus Bipolaricaulaceae bacterium]